MPPEETATPVAEEATAPVVEKTTMVTLKNLLPQTITVTVKTENGMDSLKLGPRGNSVPVPKDSLTPYTHHLVASGHVKIISVK